MGRREKDGVSGTGTRDGRKGPAKNTPFVLFHPI